jgi:hypothetical protein
LDFNLILKRIVELKKIICRIKKKLTASVSSKTGVLGVGVFVPEVFVDVTDKSSFSVGVEAMGDNIV